MAAMMVKRSVEKKVELLDNKTAQKKEPQKESLKVDRLA